MYASSEMLGTTMGRAVVVSVVEYQPGGEDIDTRRSVVVMAAWACDTYNIISGNRHSSVTTNRSSWPAVVVAVCAVVWKE